MIGVAVEGTDANAQVFQVRDGVLAERQGFYLAGGEERAPGEVAESFLLQYYGAAPAVPGRVVVGPELKGTHRRARRGARAASATPPVEVRVAPAATCGGCASWPSATPSWPWTRTSSAASTAASSASRRWPRCRRRWTWSGCRCGSRASTSPTSVRPHGRLDGRLRGRRAEEGRLPQVQDPRRLRRAATEPGPAPDAKRRAADDFAAMREVLTRRIGRYIEQADLSRTTPTATPASPALPDLIVIDGGKGQLSAG